MQPLKKSSIGGKSRKEGILQKKIDRIFILIDKDYAAARLDRKNNYYAPHEQIAENHTNALSQIEKLAKEVDASLYHSKHVKNSENDIFSGNVNYSTTSRLRNAIDFLVIPEYINAVNKFPGIANEEKMISRSTIYTGDGGNLWDNAVTSIREYILYKINPEAKVTIYSREKGSLTSKITLPVTRQFSNDDLPKSKKGEVLVAINQNGKEYKVVIFAHKLDNGGYDLLVKPGQ